MFLLSGCFQLPCVQSTVSKAPPPPIPPPRPKHKRAKRLTSIEETKRPGSTDGSGLETSDLVPVPPVEEKEEDVLLGAGDEGSETPAVEDGSNNPSVQSLMVVDSKGVGAQLEGRPPTPLFLTPASCASVTQKSVSTGSVNLEGLEAKGPLGKTLSDQGSESKPEQALDKSTLRRSLSDPDLKNRDRRHPLKSSSVMSRFRKMSGQKKHKQELGEACEVSSQESRTAEPQERAGEVEVGEEAGVLDEAEAQAPSQQAAVADAPQGDGKASEVSGSHAPHSKNFFRRVSVKLRLSFVGRSKMDCEEDAETKLYRERVKNMKEKKVEVLDLTEDSGRKPSVRKMSVVEMCSTRRAGRYGLLAVCTS